MSVDAVLAWLYDFRFSEEVRSSFWLFPTIETVHVVAITLVVGSVAVVDFRLLGLHPNRDSAIALMKSVLPWTWGAFVLAAASGSMMFVAKAPAYFYNASFQLKMFFMVLAGINMIVFEKITMRSSRAWDRDVSVPIPARIAGGLSLIFWFLVVDGGRWIGFTIHG